MDKTLYVTYNFEGGSGRMFIPMTGDKLDNLSKSDIRKVEAHVKETYPENGNLFLTSWIYLEDDDDKEQSSESGEQ